MNKFGTQGRLKIYLTVKKIGQIQTEIRNNGESVIECSFTVAEQTPVNDGKQVIGDILAP